MKVKPLGHMLLKESSELTPVVVAAAVGTVALQAFVAYLGIQKLMGSGIDIYWLKFVAIAVPLIFAGTVSASLFNREHDRKTLGFLQGLPMTAGEFYFGKVVPVVTFSALLTIFGLVSTSTVVRFFGEEISLFADMGRQQVLLTLAWGVVVIIVGATCSLTIGDVYVSIAVATLFSISLSVLATSAGWLATCVVGVTCLMVGFHKRLSERFLYLSADVPLLSRPARREASVEMFPRAAWRLGWQQIISTGRITVLVFFLTLAIALFMLSQNLGPDVRLVNSIFLMPVFATFLGTQAFAADQRKQGHRFLADRGASPTVVWSVRIVVMSLQVFVGLLPLLIFTFWQFDEIIKIGLGSFGLRTLDGLAASVLILPMLSFAVGQFYSQRCASPVVSLFCAFATMVPVFFWVLVAGALSIPAAVYGLPLVLGMLLATWRYMPNWLVGKRSLKHGWPTLAIACVAVIACYFGTSLYRVYEIPKASLPDIASLEVPSDCPQEVRSIVEQQIKVLRNQRRSVGTERDAVEWTVSVESKIRWGDTFDVQWLSSETAPFVRIRQSNVKSERNDANESLLAEIMDTENRFQFPYPLEVHSPDTLGSRLGAYLLENARLQEAKGDVDEAWNTYIRLFDVVDAMRRNATSCRWHAANSIEESAHLNLQTWALQASPHQLNVAVGVLSDRTKKYDWLDQVIFDTRAANQNHIRNELFPRLALRVRGPISNIPTDHLFVHEQERLERLVDRVAEIELASRDLRGSGRLWHAWGESVSEVSRQIFNSPIEIGEPVNFYDSKETLDRVRQASVVYTKVLLRLVESPGRSIHSVLGEVQETGFEDLKVEVAPAVSHRIDQDFWKYSDGWYAFDKTPDSWTTLVFAMPYGNGEVRAPIPPCFGQPDAKAREMAEREAADFAGTLFAEPDSDVPDDLSKLIDSGESGSLD